MLLFRGFLDDWYAKLDYSLSKYNIGPSLIFITFGIGTPINAKVTIERIILFILFMIIKYQNDKSYSIYHYYIW